MKIIISPAKKMNRDTDSIPWQDLPAFLDRAEELLRQMRSMDAAQLQALWQCNDQITALNLRRLEEMDLRRDLTPALLAYEGIQYQYMAPGVFTSEEFAYVQRHLRILSGFYGVLRPLDGVVPYRLEMQAKLKVWQAKDLYAYWDKRIAENILDGEELIINLASKEYSLCVSRFLPQGVRFVTCVFGERVNGRIREKGTMCKMARGEMVRYMAEHNIIRAEELAAFDRLGYHYLPDESDEGTMVFCKD